jgi:hypothetical protein
MMQQEAAMTDKELERVRPAEDSGKVEPATDGACAAMNDGSPGAAILALPPSGEREPQSCVPVRTLVHISHLMWSYELTIVPGPVGVQ